MSESIWKPIPGYENLYDVSDRGEVRRSANCAKVGNVVPLKLLRLKVQSNGYVSVQLFKDGVGKSCLVHRLVGSAFLGDVAGMQINHKSGNKQDNSVENLELTTAAENYGHAVRTGLAPLGSRNGSVTKPESRPRGERSAVAKLTDDDVVKMRSLRSQGITLKSIAAQFGVCFQTVHNVVSGKNWRHV